MDGHIGEDVYIGRFLFVWAIFYLTFFLGSKRKVVQGILFAAAAIAAAAGTVVDAGRAGSPGRRNRVSFLSAPASGPGSRWPRCRW